MVKITKFAQSNFLLEVEGTRLLIDPGNFNVDKYNQPPDFFRDIDVLVITHKHPDHFDQSVVKYINRQSQPTILTTAENTATLASKGVGSKVFKSGDSMTIGPFRVQGVAANHYGRWGEITGQRIDVVGVVVEVEGKRFYHTADCVPPTESYPSCDVIFVPIGGRNVFTIAEAVDFAKIVKPKVAIPMHYDAPQDSKVDPSEFAKKLANMGIEVKILNFGESLEI